jgi:hypothetical protein
MIVCIFEYGQSRGALNDRPAPGQALDEERSRGLVLGERERLSRGRWGQTPLSAIYYFVISHTKYTKRRLNDSTAHG